MPNDTVKKKSLWNFSINGTEQWNLMFTDQPLYIFTYSVFPKP